MIRINNITKIYNKRKVLNNININFREKEFVAVLGPSGCGKSTLLNIISAIEKPDEGSLFLGNLNIFKLPKKKQDYYRNNYVNYIFQNYNLINYLNVLDNLLISNKLKGEKYNKEEMFKILNKLNIKNLSKKNINILSGGEQQRVAITRSLINNCNILLADEPTGALDSKSSINIMEILKELSKEKLVIMVTHNKELAYKYASRIITLEDGIIIKDSNPYNNINKNIYKLKKNKLSFCNSLLMSIKNIKNKRFRTFLITLAYSVGLISLALVLSISNGFNNEIKNFEKEVLYNYPIIISKESLSIDNIFENKNITYQENKINVHKSNKIITNNIDDVLINKVEKINKNKINGIAYYKDINTSINDYLLVNHNNNYFDLLEGRYPVKENEILLLLDNNNSVNEIFAKKLNIENINYKEIIGQSIIINNKELLFTGIVKSNDNYYKESFGILYNSNIFEEEIISIEIFPKDYKSKQELKKYLKDYNIVDDSESVLKIIRNFVNTISYILIAFSIISLIVSIIMIFIVSYISVLERKKEIGILKTLGASSKDIKKLFLSENIIIGFLSSVITLEIVNVLGNLINNFIYKKIEISNIVNPTSKIILLIIIISITLSYISGLIPARIASKKKVVDILKSD